MSKSTFSQFTLVELCLKSLTGKQKTILFEMVESFPDIAKKVIKKECEYKEDLCDHIGDLYFNQIMGVYRKDHDATEGVWETPNIKPSRLNQAIWVEEWDEYDKLVHHFCPCEYCYSF